MFLGGAIRYQALLLQQPLKSRKQTIGSRIAERIRTADQISEGQAIQREDSQDREMESRRALGANLGCPYKHSHFQLY